MTDDMAVAARRRQSVSVKRTVEVTAALFGLGVVSGATLALGFFSGAHILLGSVAGLLRVQGMVFAVVAAAGAVSGGIIGPMVSWLFLRRVPIGRAVVTCSSGAAIGLAIGLVALGATSPILVLISGVAGVLAAALWLQRRYAPPKADQVAAKRVGPASFR